MNKDKITVIRIGVALVVAILFVIFYPKLPFKINVQIEKDLSETDKVDETESVLDSTAMLTELVESNQANQISSNEKTEATGLTYIRTRINENKGCRLGAITGNGSGVVIYANNGYSYSSIPQPLIEQMKNVQKEGWPINSIAITSSGFYCIVYGYNGFFGNMPARMRELLHQFHENHEEIMSVSISENGKYAIVTDKHFIASDPKDHEDMQKATNKCGQIKAVCITNKAICVVCDKAVYYHNIPDKLKEKLNEISYHPDRVVFTDYGTFLITTEAGHYSYLL